MKDGCQDDVYICSKCSNEQTVWEGKCFRCGFDRAIRMKQANVKRFKKGLARVKRVKPPIHPKSAFLKCSDVEIRR